MSVKRTRLVMQQYFDSHHQDVNMMADDVVFTLMATGEETHGPAGVRELLNYFYRQAFDATAETTNTVFSNGKAVVEGNFVGIHIGEFAGIPPTYKQVRVPICVVYDLEHDRIKRARVYLEMPVLLHQLEVPSDALALHVA
jgi:predicted ester cyclase